MEEKEKELFPSPHGVTVIKSFNEVVFHIIGRYIVIYMNSQLVSRMDVME